MTHNDQLLLNSYGGRAVGLSFNPSGDELVNALKVFYALIINAMDETRAGTEDPEKKLLASIAITEAQTAQMWAVKAVTWRAA